MSPIRTYICNYERLVTIIFFRRGRYFFMGGLIVAVQGLLQLLPKGELEGK